MSLSYINLLFYLPFSLTCKLFILLLWVIKTAFTFSSKHNCFYCVRKLHKLFKFFSYTFIQKKKCKCNVSSKTFTWEITKHLILDKIKCFLKKPLICISEIVRVWYSSVLYKPMHLKEKHWFPGKYKVLYYSLMNFFLITNLIYININIAYEY